MLSDSELTNTKGMSHVETTQAKGAASMQGALAKDAKGSTCGHAVLVQAFGRHQDQSNVSRQRVHEIRCGVHLLQLNDQPELVVIQVYITSAYRAYELADHYREKGAYVCLGGLHVTSLPDEAAVAALELEFV